MHWYQGGIAEAVSASKKSGAIFVVYVEGKDSKSIELTKVLDSQEVAQLLESEHFVAIKVEENSVPHQQFGQIYKDVTVPSLFFIGKSGSPLEIVKEPNTVGDIVSKIKTILQTNGVSISAQLSDEFIKTEQSSNAVNADGVCKIKLKSQPSTSKKPDEDEESSNQTDLSPEEKVDRAKELLTQKRESKRAEEEENARVKEIERRKVGQDVQKLKRWQQDNELKELMDERYKEKKEQQEARQRVLAQIEQDKAERAARFANTPNTSQAPQVVPQVSPRVTNSNTARLQFKLPDGSSHLHEFSSSSTLEDVHTYICNNINLPFSDFTLSTTFPRREFTSEDSQSTLLNLELVPNAVILILPQHHGAVVTNTDFGLMTILWSVIGPVLNLVGYIKNMLFGSALPPRENSPTPQRKRPSNENTGEPSNVPKKRIADSNVTRRQGNVHRLTDKTDSDDENNTWNGNSTQQM